MRENHLCTRPSTRGGRERAAGRVQGRERERDVGYGTYRIDILGSMALQNYKQQVAAVPYNERKITLCTVIMTEGKRALVREEREKSTQIAYLA